MNHTQTLASYAVTTAFEQVPATAAAAGKRLIKDTLACAVAGAAMPSSTIIDRVVGGYGGKPEATVLISGQKLPAPLAAHINGHYSNAIDADDTIHYKAHVAAATVAPALAIAEREGKSGRDFLLAVIMGYEVGSRIAKSMKSLAVTPSGELRFGLVSGYSSVVFAATVAAGRLLGLNTDQMRMALGIAAAAAPLPSSSQFGLELPRPMTKYALYGAHSEAGVNAALLAKEGFTAEPSVLDGERGFWRVAGSVDCDWDALVTRLGERWLVEEVMYKPYPACRFLCSCIDMFYDLVREHRVRVGEIDSITARIHGAALAKHMDVADVETAVDGMFSLPYLLSAAAHRRPGPAWHTKEARADERMRAFAKKVNVELEPRSGPVAKEDLEVYGYNRRMPASLEISVGGQVFRAERDYAWGDPYAENVRFTDEDVNQKFENFCRAAIGMARVTDAIGFIDHLETHREVAGLASLLVAPTSQVTA